MSHDLSLISVNSKCSFFLTENLELRLSLGGCPVRGDMAPSSSADRDWGTGFPVEETSMYVRGQSGHRTLIPDRQTCVQVPGEQPGVLGSLKKTLDIYFYTEHRGRSLSSLDIVCFPSTLPTYDLKLLMKLPFGVFNERPAACGLPGEGGFFSASWLLAERGTRGVLRSHQSPFVVCFLSGAGGNSQETREHGQAGGGRCSADALCHPPSGRLRAVFPCFPTPCSF